MKNNELNQEQLDKVVAGDFSYEEGKTMFNNAFPNNNELTQEQLDKIIAGVPTEFGMESYKEALEDEQYEEEARGKSK